MAFAVIAGTSAASAQEWLHLCDTEATPSGAGLINEGYYGVATKFKTETLSPHNGKEISVISIYSCAAVTEATVFVRQGTDINSAETVSEKTIGAMSKGWNYIELDSPVKIDAAKSIFAGYESYDSEVNYPIGYDGKATPGGTAYFSMFGRQYEEDESFGNHMIRLMTGGDKNNIEDKVTLNSASCPAYIEKGTPAKVKISISNNTFKSVENIVIEYTINGAKQEAGISFSPSIGGNGLVTKEFETVPINEDSELVFSITNVNGKTNESNQTVTKNVKAYDGTDAVQRTILIEKFTGQACGFCPDGERRITEATNGYEEYIAKIAHHTYQKDIFTIDASNSIAEFFNVTSAPQCMIDRTIQQDVPESKGPVWHPGYITEDIVTNEISRPAFIAIGITSDYNTGTKELTVNVKGRGSIDMNSKKINVVLTQSGYDAYQNSGWTGYLHNDFPIVFLTDYKGDALAADGDGTFDMTFSCKIEDNYGKVKVDRDKLKLVAFVSDWDTKETSEVYNAAVANVDGKTGVEDSAAEGIRIFSENGRVVVEGCDNTTVEVFDMTGAKVENNNLPRGLYIARACSENGQLCSAKVMVK